MAELDGIELAVDAAYQAGWRGDDLVTAVAIKLAENGLRWDNNNAGLNSNGSVDYGGWQINSVHGPDLSTIYDPYVNGQWAYKIWQQAGGNFSPWTGTYAQGKHLRFMDQARAAVSGYAGGDSAGVDPDAARGQLTQGATMTPRLRAETMLAGVAKAVARRAENASGVKNLDADPTELRSMKVGDVDMVRATDGGDQGELDDLNGFLQSREIIAEAGEAPASEEMLEELSNIVSEDGEFASIPGLSEEDIQPWLNTGLKRNAARGAAIARALGFDGSIGGVGQRPNASDHPHGNAIDLMTMDNMDLGWRLSRFFVRFAEELGVKYVIFDQQIASASRGWEWRQMEDRGSPTANHLDHPHVSFYGG